MAKTRTTVATQVIRAIQDDKLPDALRTGISRAILGDGDSDIVGNVLEEMVGSLGIRVERMYEYARSGKYVHGLPSGQYTNPAADARDTIQATLETIEGGPVVLNYMHWGAPNNLHIGWMVLMGTHGYNPATNQLAGLTAEKGTPVYLHDMVVVIPGSQAANISPASLEQWGIAARAGFTPERAALSESSRKLLEPTPVHVDAAGVSEYVRVEYVWSTSTGLQRSSFNIPITGYNEQRNYFQVRYTVGGSVKYWLYEDGAGTWPALDEIYDRPLEAAGSFFPFIYFRYNKQSEISDKTTQAYRTSKRLVKYLGMDYDSVAEAINANPDIADVEQAMMMFAVPAITNNELEQRYLFTFFNNLFTSQDVGDRLSSPVLGRLSTTVLSKLSGVRSLTPGIVIQDSRFKMSLRNSGIYKKKVAGSIGPVGSHTSGYDLDTTPQTVVDSVTGAISTLASTAKTHFYRRQVGPNIYEEIRVIGLQTQFHIFGEYTTIGDEEDDILIVPLDHSITSAYTITEREALYARSLHTVFNSRVITKIKWYQTGLFKAVMVIIAIIVTIFSYGTSWQSIMAALAAGAYTAAAITLLTILLEMYLYTLVFKFFVKLVGVKIGFIVAIIAAVVGAGQAINAGSIQGAPFAAELLTAASGISRAVGKELQAEVGELSAEYHDFLKDAKEQTKLLDSAKELLSNRVHLNPFVVFGEKPDDFYNRTVHSGNVGVIGIDAVGSFVDIKLMLPKLTDTLGVEGV